MSWKMDWLLLATGLAGLGLTVIQKGRQHLIELIENGVETGGQALLEASNFLIPVAFLTAFMMRLGWRVLTRTWC